jgi:hypothetical protein
MTIETEVHDYVIADPTVAGLIDTRMYPNKLPQGATLPALRFQLITQPRLRNLGGGAGRATPLLQIDCFAKGYVAAKALAAAVRARIGDFNGTLTSSRAVIAIETERDDYDDTVKADRVIQDYRISFNET